MTRVLTGTGTGKTVVTAAIAALDAPVAVVAAAGPGTALAPDH